MTTPKLAARRRPAGGEDDLREIIRLVRALIAALGQSARSIEGQTGITNAQLFVLQQLERDDGLSINDIAARALTHQSAVSIIVSRLERHGLVRRVRSREDARRAVVSLSAAGRRLARSAPPPPTSRLLAAVTGLPPRDARALRAGLANLAAAMGIGHDEPMPMFEPHSRPSRPRRRPPV